jgi:hypothetical protein
MFWADRLGKQLVTYQATLGHTIDMAGHSNTGELHTSLWYSFNKTAAGTSSSTPLVVYPRFGSPLRKWAALICTIRAASASLSRTLCS